MKRRHFIKLATATTAIGLLPSDVKAMFSAFDLASNCGDLSNRKLVLINLIGGNDGLNTVIPLNNYDQYRNLRPNIGIRDTGSQAYIKLDSTLPDNQQVGLHPALTGLKALYDSDQLRIIQSVGYPSQNGSHFASKDIYSTGNDGKSWSNGKNSGWIGRFLENHYIDDLTKSYPLAIQMGSSKTELGFHGAKEHGLSINLTGQDPKGFYTQLSALSDNALTQTTIDTHFLKELQYIIDTTKKSNTYSKAISEAFDKGKNALSYPDNKLSDQLKTVARLISGGLESKIYFVSIGGFDTHDQQIESANDINGTHNKLLTQVSTAITAFMKDLRQQALDDDVVGLTFSEFGRKIKENGNLGTDHGKAAPMFVFGKPIRGGVSGTNVNLAEATDANNYQLETVQFDYRQTFATLLQDFMGSSNSTLDKTFYNHSSNQSFADLKVAPLVKGAFSVAAGCIPDSSESDTTSGSAQHWNLFPNPFKSRLLLSADEEVAQLYYRVYTAEGSLLFESSKEVVNQRTALEWPSLAPGIYFLQIESALGTETHKLIKE